MAPAALLTASRAHLSGPRIFAVVGRVEMGANIHRCDTILFIEPWASWTRDLQRIGRPVVMCRANPAPFAGIERS